MTDQDEKRRHERTPVLLKVEYLGPEALLADYLTDVGEGGLFIRTLVDFEIGQVLDFTLSFPGLVAPMALQGVVRWRVPPAAEEPERPCGVGVAFRFADAAQQQAMLQLLATLRSADKAAAATTVAAATPCLQAEPENPMAPGPFRVLLVEDNPFVHDLFEHAVKRFHRELTDLGVLQIVSATNGQEALDLLQQQTIHLAVVDHFLPVLTGAEVVQRLRQMPEGAEMPVLVVSVGGAGVREAAMQAGADLYLDKPVLLKQLLATLRLLVAKRQQQAATTAPAAGP